MDAYIKISCVFCSRTAMLSGFSGAPAQVSVNIGVAPVCPYGYFDFAPYDCAPMATMGRIGLSGVCLSGPGHGFTALAVFMAMSTTATILVTATTGPFPARGEQAFSHFHANEAQDGHGHVATPAMTEVVNTPPDIGGRPWRSPGGHGGGGHR